MDPGCTDQIIVPRPVRPIVGYLLVPVTLSLAKRPCERTERVSRYLDKKKFRSFAKKIRYRCRQDFAEQRERVHGRFCKVEEFHSRKSTGDESSLDTGDGITKAV